eukprot:TRINITY_DN9371_c0_g3_i2.p1 TRINITY_DN9371_c0_g3~~TRINITY_DN9371_c0_g3_i2.p1  ORF type:complete len:262 (+),score=53.92 TRINITY_DN9371_c0_g3_i2:286-1071(+)
MRFIRNHLFFFYPNAFFLCSSANEKKTEGDIVVMGVNLAEEIRSFIKANGLRNLGKISFIGHSLGGVIIRAALPHLEEYKGQMHTLLTLSSPHVGYLIQTSSLVNAGMWVLKAWQKSKCLEQLLCADNKDLTKCFVYRLAKAKVRELCRIGNGVVSECTPDKFLSGLLCAICVCENRALRPLLCKFRVICVVQHRKGKVFGEMVNLLNEKLANAKVYRIDIGFNIAKKNMNNLIGREAHILFLGNETLLKLIAYRYSHVFK